MTAAATAEPATPTATIAALTFGLHSLCAQKPGGAFQVRGFYDDADELLDETGTLTAAGLNVWRGVHPLATIPTKGRAGAADIAAVHVLVADLDWNHPDAHKGTDLPTEAEVRDRLADVPIDFDIVINSGHGLQVYALLDRPVEPEHGARLQTGYLDATLARHGLHNDRSDLASILRVPGSINYKADPVDVIVERCTT